MFLQRLEQAKHLHCALRLLPIAHLSLLNTFVMPFTAGMAAARVSGAGTIASTLPRRKRAYAQISSSTGAAAEHGERAAKRRRLLSPPASDSAALSQASSARQQQLSPRRPRAYGGHFPAAWLDAKAEQGAQVPADTPAKEDSPAQHNGYVTPPVLVTCRESDVQHHQLL